MVSRLASTWAAVRYRRSQSIALVLVSALVTTCAVFAPMFVRTLEQGLLRARLVERDVADTTVAAAGRRSTADPSTTPGDIATAMPSAAAAVVRRPGGDDHGRHQGSATRGPAALATAPRRPRRRLRPPRADERSVPRGRRGRCSSRPPMPRRGAGRRARSSTSPTRRPAPASRPSDGAADRRRGLPHEARPRLLAAHPDRRQVGFPSRPGAGDRPRGRRLRHGREHLRRRLGAGAASRWSTRSTARGSRSAPSPRSARVVRASASAKEGIAVSTPVPDLVASIDSGRAIVRTPGAAAAGPAGPARRRRCSALVGQRRRRAASPEVALARLRGRSREGGSRVVMAELTFTVLLGVPLGVGVALLVGELLPPHAAAGRRARSSCAGRCVVAVARGRRRLPRRRLPRGPAGAARAGGLAPASGAAGHGARARDARRRRRGRGGARPGRAGVRRRRGALGAARAGAARAGRRAARGRPAASGAAGSRPPRPVAEGGWRRASRRSRWRVARRCGTFSSWSPRPPPSRPSPSTPWSSAPRTALPGPSWRPGRRR